MKEIGNESFEDIKNVTRPRGKPVNCRTDSEIISCVNIKLGSDEENVASFSHFHHEFTGMNLFLPSYQDDSSLAFPIQSINKVNITV